MTGFGLMLLLVSLACLYVLGLLGYRLLLSAKKLSTEIIKAKGLIEDLYNFDMTTPSKAQVTSGSDLMSLLGERRRIGQAKEQRVKSRRRRLIQRINDIEMDKR